MTIIDRFLLIPFRAKREFARSLFEPGEFLEVIVDASPALLVSDAAVIGQNMGTTFMVVRDGASTLADLTTAIKRLGQVWVEVKGVLFNDELLRISSHYGYKGTSKNSYFVIPAKAGIQYQIDSGST